MALTQIGTPSATTDTPPMNYRIFVIEAGWVLSGELVKNDGHHLTIEKANVLTRWGTTMGLGELALSGPTPDSLIHPCGTAEVPCGKVIFTLPVAADQRSKWPA
jgi:hypothetical protein